MIASYESPGGNVGDDLNHQLWDELFPNISKIPKTLVGIGSLIDPWLDQFPGNISIIGSGAGLGGLPKKEIKRKDISFVRGPLTAAALGYSGSDILDPAWLAPRMRTLSNIRSGTRGGTAIIPHARTAQRWALDGFSLSDEIEIIRPDQPLAAFVGALKGKDLVIAEAMHGAILSDAFRIPWIPIRMSPHAAVMKWMDALAPVGIRYRPQEPRDGFLGLRLHENLGLVTRGRKRSLGNWLTDLSHSIEPNLSDQSVVDEKCELVIDQVEALHVENSIQFRYGGIVV